MATPSANERTGTVEVDYRGLITVCAEQGKIADDVLKKLELNDRTRSRIRNEEPIRRVTLNELLRVIGPQNFGRIVKHSLGAPTKPVADNRNLNDDHLVEWTDTQVLTSWITLPNDLQYMVSKRRHRHVADTFARVKRYELRHLSDDRRQKYGEHLTRHPAVCRRLTPHPRIPINQGAFPNDSGSCWWVIDYWIDGTFLSEVLAKERLSLPEIIRIGRELAEGLKLLHDNEIVRRELNPQHVLLRKSDRSVVLTDFELAKLLGGAPTVAKGWPADPYRAPELAEGAAVPSVDIYSWGRIMSYMALGVLPATGREKKSLLETDLPEPLINLISLCVANSPRNRPSDMQSVMNALTALK